MDTLTLSQADTRRLEKLAHEAGRTPNGHGKDAAPDVKLAMPVSLSRERARGQSNRCASFTLMPLPNWQNLSRGMPSAIPTLPGGCARSLKKRHIP